MNEEDINYLLKRTSEAERTQIRAILDNAYKARKEVENNGNNKRRSNGI